MAIVEHHTLEGHRPQRRGESLPVANEPQPERVVVLDYLSDGSFESKDVRVVA
jgi:hypothetical protein